LLLLLSSPPSHHSIATNTCVLYPLYLKSSNLSHLDLATAKSEFNMAVIWGLDLREMQWGKFKGSYMFNQDYHLRRMKMIVYQIAMILCVISESVGTAALSG
jgi:hypothetical protein